MGSLVQAQSEAQMKTLKETWEFFFAGKSSAGLRGSPAAGFKFGTGASPAGLTCKKKHSALKKFRFYHHISLIASGIFKSKSERVDRPFAL